MPESANINHSAAGPTRNTIALAVDNSQRDAEKEEHDDKWYDSSTVHEEG